ncbi:hypothetical protein CJ030_MR1G019237 [Morella rubra]|uniref:Uncharacterized protein n=1 Tax=Morella rubra TaxID=262757 RepID=A0A6A1WMW3_9ROSI|nr:hypothetical protein CJ030_MR1G019237 [Morella rubra]
METLVSIKENYVYLVKLVFANFQFSKSEDADSYVNGKMLDLSSSSLNSLANAPDDGKKFFENHASFVDIKEEQRRLGQQLEKLSLDMKTGFDDIKELFAAHDERFNLLDKDVRLLKHQVNNSVRVATDVIQATVKDLKSSAQDVITATEVSMDVDRNLRPHVMKWTYCSPRLG